MKMLVIHWREIATGKRGHGRPMNADTAKAWVLQFNEDWPSVQHWTEEPQEGEGE